MIPLKASTKRGKPKPEMKEADEGKMIAVDAKKNKVHKNIFGKKPLGQADPVKRKKR